MSPRDRDSRSSIDPPPHVAAQIAAPREIVREEVTGKYDTEKLEAEARARRAVKDAELAAIGTIDLRIRMGDLEREVGDLKTTTTVLLTLAQASERERQRRHDAEEAAAIRRADFRKLLLNRVAPILVGVGAVISALAYLKWGVRL